MQFDEAYYRTVYGDYRRQNPARKLAFYRRLVERHAGAGGRVLDLGCAFGLFLGGLPERYARFGVDASEHAIRAAARRIRDGRFAVGDCARPPLRGPFDVITAFDVLEHIQDLDGALAYIDGALAPGGVLVFVVPVYDGPLGPVIQALDRDPTHVHKRSRAWWLERLSERFDIAEWTGILRYLLPPGFYVHLPSRWIRGFAPAIAVAARQKRTRVSEATCYTHGQPH